MSLTRLVEISQAILPFVQAIPFVNSIAAAIPVVMTAIQAWIKKHSLKKKVRSGFLIAILIASFTIMALATAGSGFMFIGAVAAFLTGVGVWVKYLDPYLKQRAKLKMKEKDYAAYQALLSRDDLFNENETPHHHDTLKILQACLLHKVEEAWVQEKINDKERDVLVQKITQDPGTFIELQQDKTMRKVRGELSLHDFLIIDLSQYEKSYREEIRTMRETVSRSRAYAITSITNLIGIILLIIPTPPTIFLGAALMVISTVINVALLFEWDIKLKRAFGWTSKNREKLTEPTQDKARGPTPAVNLQNRLNNQKQQKEQPTHRRSFTVVISRKLGGSRSTPTPPEAGTPSPAPRKGKK